MSPLRTLIPFALLAALLVAPGASAGEGDGGRTQRRITSSEAYVPTPTLSAAISKGYHFEGLLVVDAGFDIPDPQLRSDVAKMMPQVTDALRTALAEYTYSRYHAGAAPDPDRIEAMLQQATNQVVRRPGAQVLLSNVMVQQGR